MKRFFTILTPLFFSLNLSPILQAQTCCSGGVPVSSNLGLPPTAEKVLQISLNYDLNTLETLKNGTERINDDSRSRKTHSVMVQVGYGITKKIAFDVFIPWVKQDRTINQFGSKNLTSTNGIGDLVLLGKYTLYASDQNETTLVGGLGVKFPTGSSDQTDDRGITLNADLQPGSGAMDGLVWMQFTNTLAVRPSLSLLATGIYSYKGKNENYFGGTQEYQFGEELRIRAGLTDRWILGKALIDPALIMSYRLARPDRVDGSILPNTGGNWLFVNPGVTLWIAANTSTNINVELPLMADITGVQVTPTYRINVGLFQRLSWNKTPEIEPNPVFD